MENWAVRSLESSAYSDGPVRSLESAYSDGPVRSLESTYSEGPDAVDVDGALARKYELSGRCGGRGHVVVFKAFERERRRFVALKLSRGAFGDGAAAVRAYREVVHLQHLCGHPNVARLREVHVCDNGRDLCLTLDFAPADLRACINAGRLGPAQRAYVAMQLLCALEHVHAARVAHRDVQPANVLLDDDCRAKLSDFCSSRFVGEASRSATGADERRRLTDDVGGLWYRPYDSLLGSDAAGGCAADLWACGCCIVEMETQAPLFPGATRCDTLSLQYAALGAPNEEELRQLKCGPTQLDALAKAAALDASRRAAGLRDESPNFFERIEEAHRLRERLAKTPKRPCAGIAAARDGLLDYDTQVREAERRAHVADLAALLVNIVPVERSDATTALRHPLFAAFAAELAGRPRFAGGALHEALGGGLLLDGNARQPPAFYRDRLADAVDRQKGSEAMHLRAPPRDAPKFDQRRAPKGPRAKRGDPPARDAARRQKPDATSYM
ncbi:kinase-like domain-containing protein [Pelagophyceae sp. CCMP2097]|nr:kinase-like domain-containing protein [Pelagophyceae sp. CCMP2097]